MTVAESSVSGIVNEVAGKFSIGKLRHVIVDRVLDMGGGDESFMPEVVCGVDKDGRLLGIDRNALNIYDEGELAGEIARNLGLQEVRTGGYFKNYDVRRMRARGDIPEHLAGPLMRETLNSLYKSAGAQIAIGNGFAHQVAAVAKKYLWNVQRHAGKDTGAIEGMKMLPDDYRTANYICVAVNICQSHPFHAAGLSDAAAEIDAVYGLALKSYEMEQRVIDRADVISRSLALKAPNDFKGVENCCRDILDLYVDTLKA